MNALIHILKSGVDTVWHNATFDMGLIYTLTGVEPVGNVHDTMIIMHLLDEELMSYKLKDLAPRYLKIDADPYEEMFGKNAKFSQVPLSIARYYAAKDTWLGYLLFKWQVSILDKPQFEKIKKSYLHIELPCIKTTFHTERTGFVMDKEEAARQKVECDERIAELTTRIQNAGTEVVEAKVGAGSATLSMATAGARFALKVVRGLMGEPGVTEYGYTEGDGKYTKFFAQRLRFGTEGWDKTYDIGKISAFEQKCLDELKDVLNGNIKKGVDFATEWVQANK